MWRPKSILMSEPTPTQVPESSNDQSSSQQDQIDLLIKEVQSLKNKESKAGLASNKEMYSWPRSYSFKFIDNKIISHFDMMQDITNKNLNGFGYYEVQTCKITYTDGTTEEKLYGDYMNSWKSSKKYELKSIKRQFRLFMKGSHKPIIMDAHEALDRYTKIIRGSQSKVWNYDILDSESWKVPTPFDIYTFQIFDLDEDDNFIFNDGKEFVVDSTAIN